MKNKVIIGTLMMMTFAFITAVPTNAQTYGGFADTRQIKLIDDIANDKESIEKMNEYLEQQYGENYEEKLANNQKAVESVHKIESTFQRDEKGDSIYPNYVGGLYINENDKLVIQIVKNNMPTSDSKEYSNYKDIFKMGNDASVEFVNYSYENLKAVHDFILDNFLGKNSNITGLYIDVIQNKVVVELREYNNHEFKKIEESGLNTSMISFDEGSSFSNVVNTNPGAKFMGTMGSCSYGYRAKTSAGKVGMVTAGHCFNANGNSVSGIGTVTLYRNNGTLDAAFIQTNSGVTPTNTLNQSQSFGANTISTSVTSSYVAGQKITKLGYASGYSNGTVRVASYSYTDGGVTYSDLVRANLKVQPGDSGGIVMETQIFYPNTSYTTFGIVKAAGEGAFAGEALITKASKINSTFGLSRY